MSVFKELYQYRELLKTNVKKDIRGKYKASFLGVLWSFINPLLQVLVYAIVFPYIMKVQTENYLIFLICGIIPWTWFTTVISQGTTCITNNANLIKKVYFPREILPISIVTSGLINFLISCIIILIFVIINISLLQTNRKQCLHSFTKVIIFFIYNKCQCAFLFITHLLYYKYIFLSIDLSNHDIYNSTLCVINYSCPSLDIPPLLFLMHFVRLHYLL